MISALEKQAACGLEAKWWQSPDQKRIRYFLREPKSPLAAKIVFLHATGFHSGIWLQVIACLPESFGICCVDARGHGQSDPDDEMRYTWQQVAEDARGVLHTLQWKKCMLVGHSMGGAAAMMLASQSGPLVAKLVLLDPTIFPNLVGRLLRWTYALTGWHFSDYVKKRKNHFESVEAMRIRFSQKLPFSLWNREVLEDYCQYALRASDKGGFVLACAPKDEAAYYRAGMFVYPNQWCLINQPTILCVAQRAPHWWQMDFSFSPTDPSLARRLTSSVQKIDCSHLTHFIPMQDPKWVGALIEKEADFVA